MKKTLIIGLLIVSHSIFAQIPGKRFDGPIVIFDTLTIKIGDVILLGKGSDPNSGNFIHITTHRNKLTSVPNKVVRVGTHTELINIAEGISYNYNGKAFAIEYFNKVASQDKGDIISGVINIGASFGKLDQEVYKQAVNFEAAIRAGEIIKINEIDFAKPRRTIKRTIPQFIFAQNGVQPIDIVFDGISKNELYAGTLTWCDDYYKNRDESILTVVENEEVGIVGLKKGILLSRIMGIDLFADVEYRFLIGFNDNAIRMAFSLGGEDGQLTEDVSQADYFDKKGEIRKMYKDLKVAIEQVMNELSSSLVDSLME